ncbi:MULTISPECIES: hypothetical protein [Nocardia]|uniref:hypothetical protein n=1 Tax=Nocardia TaxID=1817 RepID=UPI0002E1AB9B|nr:MULTISPECIES: hypothetical protein [Nocardia]
MNPTPPAPGHHPDPPTPRAVGNDSSWFGQIPSAHVLFRAWHAPEFVAAHYPFPTLVDIAVQMLDAHHEYRAAFGQLLRLPPGHTDSADITVLTDSLHSAHHRLGQLVERIDDHLAATLTPPGHRAATSHRDGLGTEISQLCRCWITAIDPTIPSKPGPRAHHSLFGRAVVYDLLAADVAAGRVHLPARIPQPADPPH